MRSVGTKLTFLIVVFPISLIVTLSIGVLYLYHQSLEASVIVEVMSALSSVVLVDLLVWERLRDSLSKKLNYLHENYLSELHNSFKRRNVFRFYTPPVKKIIPDLKRYGKFMGISLYPKDLLSKIDGFLISYENFNKKWVKIESIGKEHCGKEFDEYVWCHVLGIEHLRGSYKKGTPEFKLHEDKAQLAEKKHSKLIEETESVQKRQEECWKRSLKDLKISLRATILRYQNYNMMPETSWLMFLPESN